MSSWGIIEVATTSVGRCCWYVRNERSVTCNSKSIADFDNAKGAGVCFRDADLASGDINVVADLDAAEAREEREELARLEAEAEARKEKN